jgi:hypothetical protein
MSRGARLSILLLLAAACGEAKKPAPPPAATPTAEVKPAAPAVAASPTPAIAQPFDAVGEAAGSYRVGAVMAPSVLKSGAKAVVVVTIEMTRPDVHVQKEFPLKATLVATRGLKLAKASVGHADAVDPAAGDRHWNVPVTAVGRGEQRVDVALRFAICRETEPAWCVVRNETVSAAAEVR